jgi:Uma2 family endonuclease
MLMNRTSLYNREVLICDVNGDLMTAEAIETGLGDDDLLHLGSMDQWVEVINGEIIHMSPVGIQHVIIAANAYEILKPFVTTHKLGYVFTDSLIYVLERSPQGKVVLTRIPDASFVRRGRLTKDFDLKKPFPGAPDLAIEVVSPQETADTILEKVRDYLEHGSEQVWVLYSDHKEWHQYINGEDIVHIYRAGDTFEAPTLFPGLTIVIADLFTLPNFD